MDFDGDAVMPEPTDPPDSPPPRDYDAPPNRKLHGINFQAWR